MVAVPYPAGAGARHGLDPRRPGTYLISGAVLAFSAWLFDTGVLNAAGQTFIWIVIFFFPSAGASAGHLTVSEIFPIEIRAETIAVFFAIAQTFGAIAPLLYGAPRDSEGPGYGQSVRAPQRAVPGPHRPGGRHRFLRPGNAWPGVPDHWITG